MRGVDRQSELKRWIESRVNVSPLELEPASADASFRRYFRVRAAGATLIAMDAPPAHEDCRPFVRMLRLFCPVRRLYSMWKPTIHSHESAALSDERHSHEHHVRVHAGVDAA